MDGYDVEGGAINVRFLEVRRLSLCFLERSAWWTSLT